MKWIKTAFTLALAAGVLYLALMISVSVVLHRQSGAISETLRRNLGVESVSVRDFFNLPFLFVEMRDVSVRDSRYGDLDIGRLALHYDVWKFLWAGLERSVHRVAGRSVLYRGGTGHLAALQSRISGNRDGSSGTNGIPGSLVLTLADFRADISLPAGVQSEFRSDRSELSVNRGRVRFRALWTARSGNTNQPDNLSAGGELRLVLSTTNGFGSGALKISSFSVGPVILAKNADIPFGVTNGLLADYRSTNGSLALRSGPDGWIVSVSNSFRTDSARYDERSFLEFLLLPGDYVLEAGAEGSVGRFRASAAITGLTNPGVKPVDISVARERGRLSVRARIDTVKSGYLNARLDRLPGQAFPGGTFALRDFFVMDGLRLGGQGFIAVTGDKTAALTVNDIRLNGGPLGNAATRLLSRSNGVELAPPGPGFNEAVRGFVGSDRFQLAVDVRDVSGAAIVSNIYIDFMGISKARVGGRMTVRSDPEKFFILEANAVATVTGADGVAKKYAETSLVFNAGDLKLTFRDLNFPLFRLIYNGTFSFAIYDRMTGLVDFKGTVNNLRRYDYPLTGTVVYDSRALTTLANFALDEAVFLRAEYVTNTMALNIRGDNYPLTRWGLDGRLSADVRAGWTLDRIQSFSVKGRYTGFGEDVSIAARAATEQGRLRLTQFLLDNRDDRMMGTGRVWQDGGRLNAEIGFLRGGEIRFSSSLDDIRALVDVRNLYFANFLGKKNRKVLLSARLEGDGPLLLPDMKGFLRIVNTSNSGVFTVDCPSIQKTGGDVVIRSAVYQDETVRADFQARYSPAEDGSVLLGEGTVNLLGTLRGRLSASYFTQTNQRSLSYDLRGLTLNGRFLRDYSGGFIFKNNRYTFFRKGDRGFSGYYARTGASLQEWNLDLSDSDIRGSFSGEIRGRTIRSDLQVTGELYLLSVLGLFRDLDGNGSVRLRVGGNGESPDVDGDIRLYNAGFGMEGVSTRVRGMNLSVPIQKSRMIFNRSRVPTTTGDFLVNGYVDIQDLFVPSVHLMVLPAEPEKRQSFIGIGFLSPSLRVNGEFALSNFGVTGTPSALFVEGVINADNCTVELPSITPARPGPVPDWVANIRWNLPVRIGNSVKFANEFVDAFLRKGDALWIQGSLADGTFAIRGRTGVERGTLTYLGRDFMIREGSANFYGNAMNPEPYVVLATSTTYRDEKNENIDVYLTFEGKVSTIVVRDFYSVPSKSRNELAAVLGLSVERTGVYDTGSSPGAGSLFVSGVSAAQNFYFFNPLGTDIRRRLGLDLFTIRTGLLETWARQTVGGETNIDPLSFFEGTSLIVGKYVFPNVFIQYEMTLTRDPFSELELVPLHTVGVELDLRTFDLGWKYRPVSELGRGIRYEQRFELNINRQF